MNWMEKITLLASAQRIFVGVVFGFVLGVVLYQSSKLPEEPFQLRAQTTADCDACTSRIAECDEDPDCISEQTSTYPPCLTCLSMASSPDGSALSGTLSCDNEAECGLVCTTPGFCQPDGLGGPQTCWNCVTCDVTCAGGPAAGGAVLLPRRRAMW